MGQWVESSQVKVENKSETTTQPLSLDPSPVRPSHPPFQPSVDSTPTHSACGTQVVLAKRSVLVGEVGDVGCIMSTYN